MGHCAATAIYIAKGSLQTRVSFKPLPIWMKVAFILPHVLLVIAVACGTYGVYSPCVRLSLTTTS